MGIEVFTTSSPSIGGVIRESAEDFVVEEVLVDGSVAEVNQTQTPVETKVLHSSLDRNRYLLCVLVKRRWDTISAVRAVANKIGVNEGRIYVAGLKDSEAITAQHIAIEGVSAKDVHGIRIKDIEVRPIGYFRDRLSSYYLMGNRFQVAISSIAQSKSAIKRHVAQTVEELTSMGGVPNFFGHQRFGTRRAITHLVGQEIVKGNIERAVMIFLAKSSPVEHPASRQARESLQATQNLKQALRDFPKQLHYERLMLSHLVERPLDYVGAFRRLPLKLQELFPQAYQSFLFNRFLSKRVSIGHRLDRAEVGDRVVSIERSGLPIVKMDRLVSPENLAETNKAIGTGRMRLALPLIGFKLRSSLGFQGEVERQVLEGENVKLEGFKITAMPEISLRGGLRCALAPMIGFALGAVSKHPVDAFGCKVKVSFALQRGSYATIVLRELMKPRDPVKAGF